MKLNLTQLLFWIFTVLLSVFGLVILFSSCDTAKRAQRHYDKAVKLGVRCETLTDTLTLTKIDSVLVNNEWVKSVTKYDTIVRYNEVFVPKTRYEIKTEYKLKRDTIELLRYQTKTEYKTIKAEQKKMRWYHWFLIIVSFGIGMYLGDIFRIFKRRI